MGESRSPVTVQRWIRNVAGKKLADLSDSHLEWVDDQSRYQGSDLAAFVCPKQMPCCWVNL